ncbi:hypothetical protein [uncultured Nocardioides sp.]|uniref:pilus assembly protein TadG-related protein n=1 Tax=uncultured Nocardioides sp. TaxID=198441 RepID=UPI0030F85F47
MTRGRRDERGAVAVFLAVTVSLLVIVGAFAVDLGMQRVVRRDMQALADVVALDLARELDGRTTAQLAPQLVASSSSSALARSLAGNQTTLGDNRAVVATWGFLNGGAFTPSTSGQVPTAVKVSAGADIGFSFTSGRGAATRTAYAEAATTACHRLGSFAAALSGGDSVLLSPLNGLLGLNLSLLSYRNIAAVDVTLAELAASPQLGTESELLTAPVSFAALVDGTIHALNASKPDGYAAAVSALGSFASVAGTVPAVTLGTLLSVSPGDSAALQVPFNVLDLVAGSLLVANGERAVSIPNLQAGVAGLGNQFNGSIGVQQRASLACGSPNSLEARATGSQLAGDLGLNFVNLPSLNVNLELVKGNLKTAKGTGVLRLGLGNATSQLVDPPPVYCGAGTVADPDRFSVDVTSGLATYSIDVEVQVTGDLDLDLLIGKLGVDVDVVVGLTLTSPVTGDPAPVQLAMPPNDTVPVETGTSVQALTTVVPSIRSASVTVAGVQVNAERAKLVTDTVIEALTVGNNNFLDKTLRPFAANVDSMLVGPLAELLGLRLGGADVFAVSASCAIPSLRG